MVGGRSAWCVGLCKTRGKKVWVVFRGRVAELEVLQRLLETLLGRSTPVGYYCA